MEDKKAKRGLTVLVIVFCLWMLAGCCCNQRVPGDMTHNESVVTQAGWAIIDHYPNHKSDTMNIGRYQTCFHLLQDEIIGDCGLVICGLEIGPRDAEAPSLIRIEFVVTVHGKSVRWN